MKKLRRLILFVPLQVMEKKKKKKKKLLIRSSIIKKGNYNRNRRNSKVVAFIEYFQRDKRGEIFTDNVSIRIMGDVSRIFIKKKFPVCLSC